jgi:SAM-dependent methyltransferase
MVSIKENKAWWAEHYDWRHAGDEWSRPWGGPHSQWHGSILPRIHRFLPAPRILEIACGFGRWTQFLKDQCDHLTALDLSESCVAACRERFSDVTNITYAVNDGCSLDMIEDSSIDFVFSFDSLVHADRSTVEAYLAQLPRILTPDGVAFLHHSNLGECSPLYRRVARVPKLSGLLVRMRVLEYLHIRDPSVSAAGVAAYAESAGLRCISQELTTWLTRRTFIDCISTIVRANGPHARANRVVRNAAFRREAAYVATLAALYSPDGAASGDA